MNDQKRQKNTATINAVKIADIIREGGATLNKNGDSVNFKNGYQVSKKDCYKISVENVQRITQAVNKLLNSISNGDFVGLWVDNGFIYIDISERIHNLKRALKIGKGRRQISIFSWLDGQCIYC